MKEKTKWHITFDLLQLILSVVFHLLLEYSVIPLWLKVIVYIVILINLSIFYTRFLVYITDNKNRDINS